MQKLTQKEDRIYKNSLRLSRNRKFSDREIIANLRDVHETRLFKKLDFSSLFTFALEVYEMSRPLTYSFHAVAKKTSTCPTLRRAIENRDLLFSKACRIVSALTPENEDSLVKFACEHTEEEINAEVAKINPRANSPDQDKILSEDVIQMRTCVSKTTLVKIKRAQSLLPDKCRGECIEMAFDMLLDKIDPVRKAERAKPSKKSFCENRKSQGRVPLTAAEKHAVFSKCQGKCTHINANGERCNTDRWVEIHHIIPVSHGGTNDPENLTLLCSHHHDLLHRYGFSGLGNESVHRPYS